MALKCLLSPGSERQRGRWPSLRFCFDGCCFRVCLFVGVCVMGEEWMYVCMCLVEPRGASDSAPLRAASSIFLAFASAIRSSLGQTQKEKGN